MATAPPSTPRGKIPTTRVTIPTPLEDSNTTLATDGSYFEPLQKLPLPETDSIDNNSDSNTDDIDNSGLSVQPRRQHDPNTRSEGRAATRHASLNCENSVNNRLRVPDVHQRPARVSGWSWRELSRSPSPIGLIPIHRHFRTLVHKYEVPRKVLHASIGFFALMLYRSGYQTSEVAPWLMAALLPITTADLLRHNIPQFNSFYVSVLGALMREGEFAGYNGVIFYLLGAWIVLQFLPKDVAFISILLLSWCDTAASTFGRLWGRYTPRIRRGKSVAGSLAAFVVGSLTAAWFWGWWAPRHGPYPGDERFPFLFTGTLRLPCFLVEKLRLQNWATSVAGPLALGIISTVSGVVASLSEMVDVWGWDDNLTIPVLSGLGIWGFLKVFGGA